MLYSYAENVFEILSMLKGCTKEKVILWFGLFAYSAKVWVFRIVNKLFGQHGSDVFSPHWVALYRNMISVPDQDHLWMQPVLIAMHEGIQGEMKKIERWETIVEGLQTFYAGICLIY